MMHVIAGLFLIAFGIWGVMDEWYYALDFLKAAGSLALTGAGLLALLGGVFGQRRTPPNPDEDETDAETSDSRDQADDNDSDAADDDALATQTGEPFNS